jgi:cytochrome c peroxidase
MSVTIDADASRRGHRDLALHERDIDDLVALMASFTSPSYRGLGARELARQRQRSRTARPQRDSARAFGPKPVQPQRPKV